MDHGDILKTAFNNIGNIPAPAARRRIEFSEKVNYQATN